MTPRQLVGACGCQESANLVGASWPTADGAAGRVGEAGWGLSLTGTPAGAVVVRGVSAVTAWPAMSPTMRRCRVEWPSEEVRHAQ
jgi:hypothetical protein